MSFVILLSKAEEINRELYFIILTRFHHRYRFQGRQCCGDWTCSRQCVVVGDAAVQGSEPNQLQMSMVTLLSKFG